MRAVLLLAAVVAVRTSAGSVFSDCGGVLRDPRGVISTPGFPGPYPVPIACRWVIEAAPRQRVALYLTQFYMREGVTLSEYVFYSDEQMNMGGTTIGTISSEAEPTHVLSNKPVLVLDFQVGMPRKGDRFYQYQHWCLCSDKSVRCAVYSRGSTVS